MEEKELTQAIKRYLGDDSDNYAIMVTGPWGCGKTHYVENCLRREVASDGWHIVRVSMFGITSEDIFYDRLLSAILSSKESDIRNSLADIGSLSGRFGRFFRHKKKKSPESPSRFKRISKDVGISALMGQMKKAGIQMSVEARSLVELLLGKGKVIVFDDLERCLLDETRLLGLMDTMIESQGRKVILLANEKELRSKLAASDRDGDASRKYLAAKEKLVWRVYPFEPDMKALAHELFRERLEDLLGCEEGECSDAINRCLASLFGPGESNVRLLKRAMSICDVLESTGYFMGSCDDPRRIATLENVLALSGKVVRDTMRSGSDEADHNDSRGQSFVEHFMEASSSEGLAALPFIERYLKHGQVAESETIVAELREFQVAYHPEGAAAQRADASISRWQHRSFQNSDIPVIVEDIASSIIPPSDGGLSFDRYRDALEVLYGIQKCIPDQNVGVQDVVSNMKRAIDAEPEAALSSVEHGIICWQAGGFPKSMERIGAIDELREYICQKSLSSSVDAARSILEKPEGLRPSDIISVINGERGLTRSAYVLTSLNPELAARKLAECSNEGVHEVHSAILSSKTRAMMLHADEGAAVREWLLAFAEAIEPSSASELANRDVLEWIRGNIWEMLGVPREDQQEEPSGPKVGGLAPRDGGQEV
ncbi:P-loop NTPase fold protein [Adlercreutzia caecimuris]|uniref:P-loop NTPase fold protein n=3 Tax=Adlercreutzia caecimuris TaxID=671266 RepID=UPI00272C7C0D|nr:P-loop NTPase fold protein [Adlercreutzia caecimuris]